MRSADGTGDGEPDSSVTTTGDGEGAGAGAGRGATLITVCEVIGRGGPAGEGIGSGVVARGGETFEGPAGDETITYFIGGAGVESMTLGREGAGDRDARPTPIRARFESSTSRGQGSSV